MGIREKINQVIDNNHYNGVLLIEKRNEILLKEAYGFQNKEKNIRNSTATVFPIASITKQFTAAGILKLVEENKLRVQDPISTYLPDFKAGKDITIHHILSNSSGIANFSLDMDFTPFIESENITKSLVEYIISQPLMFEPGSQFFYSISGYLILQYLIETISGIDYESFLKKNFFDKLGMTDTGFLFPDRSIKNLAIGYENLGESPKRGREFDMRIAGGGGALYSTLDDLLKWKHGLLEYQILKKSSVDLMFSSHIRADEVNSYGYGMIIAEGEILENPRIKYYHPGGGFGIRTFFTIYPKEDLCILMLSNLGDPKIFNETRIEIDQILLKE